MQGPRIATASFARALLLVAALAGCALPRSGPTLGEIKRGGNDPALDMHVVEVTPPIAAASRSAETLGFGAGFVERRRALAGHHPRPATRSRSAVWENVDAGLLVGVGQKATTLEAIQVDQSGDIFVPYAGRLQAAGRTPDELRRRDHREPRRPDPGPAGRGAPRRRRRRDRQRHGRGQLAGGLSRSRRRPCGSRRCWPAAGGVALVPDVAQIKVERGGQTGRIWLQDLYDNPRYDIALRAGDRIIVEEDRRSFTALGATTGQSRVPFNKRDLSVIEAIATVGGLDGRTANPSGVFVFRDEPAAVANRVLARGDLVGTQRMAYLLNLTEPEGVFAAREFTIRDEDTIYIAETPLGNWTRVLAIATAAAAIVTTADRLGS